MNENNLSLRFSTVYHAERALKVAPACLKFKLLKAESLALLGRTEVKRKKILESKF